MNGSVPVEAHEPSGIEQAHLVGTAGCTACIEIPTETSSSEAHRGDAAAEVRDQAASDRDARAEDRDEDAELRDRLAERRDAALGEDQDALLVERDHATRARTEKPAHLAQTTRRDESRDGDDQAAAVPPVADGDVKGDPPSAGTLDQSTNQRQAISVPPEGTQRSRVRDAARLEDTRVLAKRDRLAAADDRGEAGGDRESSADNRREGARDRAVARLQRSESALAERRAVQTLESMSDAFFTLDSEWRFTYVNPQSEAILERSRADLIGKSMWEEFPWGFGLRFDDEYRRVLREQAPVRFEACYEPLGRLLEVRIFPVADGLAVYFSDITIERRQEERLRQTQRLEAIGQTTAGVAHDFGNILIAVRGFAQLGLAASGDEKVSGYLAEIDRAGHKAAELTGQLLAFARQQELAPTVIDLNDVVEGLSSMLAQLVTPAIELQFALSPTPVVVFVDRSQLEQVLVNLVMNGNDAIETSGTITVATCASDPVSIPHERRAPSGWLQVTDDGSGIPTEVMPHIFDPFFTTKPPELGTGLGLATIYGIVAQSGGGIIVDSTPGIGTTMTVALPHPRSPTSIGDHGADLPRPAAD